MDNKQLLESWSSLYTLPEVRKAKRVFNKNYKTIAKLKLPSFKQCAKDLSGYDRINAFLSYSFIKLLIKASKYKVKNENRNSRYKK